jgi:hypothetical protein
LRERLGEPVDRDRKARIVAEATTASLRCSPVIFEDLPLADAGREALALELFRLEMSPEEYAARFGHEFALFSFDENDPF